MDGEDMLNNSVKEKRRIVLVPKDKSYDSKHMQNLLRLASELGHPNGQSCTSGDSLEFAIEEKEIMAARLDNAEVYRYNPEKNSLIKTQ